MGPFFLVLAVFAVAAVIWYWRLKKLTAAWDQAAHQMGFQRLGVSGTSAGTIYGERQGAHLTIGRVTKGNGNNNNETYTRYYCEYPAVGPPVKLTKQNAFSFVNRMLGRNDVLIGDPGFDERVVITTNAPEAVNAFLTPARKIAILNLFESHSQAEVTERSIQVDVRGTEMSPQNLASMARWAIDFSLFLSKPSDVDIALANQASGNLGQAVDQLHDINAAAGPEGPNSFTQLLEAEGHMAMGDGAAAAEILDHMDVTGNKEAEGLREVAHRHLEPPLPPARKAAEHRSTPPMPEEASEPVPTSAAPAEIAGPNLEQTAVIADLFSSHRTGYEVEEHFLDNYVGHEVSWTGPVTRSMTYRFDSDFEGTGLKVNIELGELDNGQLIANTITAVVQLEDNNEVERGEQITIYGTLHRVDRYMRNIYVRDAEII